MRSKAGKWKLWHYYTVPYIDPALGDVDYLRRWYLVECPWFTLLVQCIGGPDESGDLHDHPWSFLSILLRGSYGERTNAGSRHVERFNFKWAEDFHTIEWLWMGRPVWSFLFCGPRRRVWGFATEDGWVPFNKYLKRGEEPRHE